EVPPQTLTAVGLDRVRDGVQRLDRRGVLGRGVRVAAAVHGEIPHRWHVHDGEIPGTGRVEIPAYRLEIVLLHDPPSRQRRFGPADVSLLGAAGNGIL